MSEHLFVYGTLKFGHGNHRQIKPFVQSTRPATIKGVLVDLGGIPGLLQGEGVVKGELLEVAPEALSVTDRIEGFHPDRAHNFYVRQRVEVCVEGGGTTSAWTYFLDPVHQRPDLALLQVDERDGLRIHAWPAK